jgi:hypothetical protein
MMSSGPVLVAVADRADRSRIARRIQRAGYPALPVATGPAGALPRWAVMMATYDVGVPLRPGPGW